MKFNFLILSLVIGTFAIPSTASALDPSIFLKVLNVDIEQLKTSSGDFIQAQKQLGITTQIDTGDAASYVGRVEYILRNRPELLTLFITECTEGYHIEWANPSDRSSKTVMKPNVPKIEVGGLYLGMNKIEAEKIFTDSPAGGWSIEESKKTPDSQKITYKKTIRQSFCDRIWITMKFDKYNKLSKYDIESGGCDDQACERDANEKGEQKIEFFENRKGLKYP